MKAATQEAGDSSLDMLPVRSSLADRFECVGECVLLKRLDQDDSKTSGGIIKPDVSQEKSHRGVVVALGEGRLIGDKWMPINLHVGDVVRFTRHAVGVEEEIDGETYLKLHWKQIHLREKS